jgi:hypothetical protein
MELMRRASGEERPVGKHVWVARGLLKKGWRRVSRGERGGLGESALWGEADEGADGLGVYLSMVRAKRSGIRAVPPHEVEVSCDCGRGG